MSTLVFDQPVIERLKAVVVNAEIRDERGDLIGYFQPAVTPETVERYECPFSDEELLAIEREGRGRPLADILSDLRNRS
jgi:hypothetical protein